MIYSERLPNFAGVLCLAECRWPSFASNNFNATVHKTSRRGKSTEVLPMQRHACESQVGSSVKKFCKMLHWVASDRAKAGIRGVHRRPALGRRPAAISPMQQVKVEMEGLPRGNPSARSSRDSVQNVQAR